MSAQEIDWRATLTDPKVYMRPITVALPLRNDNIPDRVFEYACHEGNYNLEGELSGARFREPQAAEAQPK